jgi:energy-coupling factor transporter ATP-binding protein EcfA2
MPPTVFIERLVVEEGFLDGLDLEFRAGLNVIVGPRGVGKTSVIQLLRFCLGIRAFSDSFEHAALRHAQDILGDDGRVSVRLMVDGEPVVISRRKRDDRPEGYVDAVPQPIVLAQTEIEEIGVDPEGRLRLIDGFRSGSLRLSAHERASVSEIRSLTLELAELETDIEQQHSQVADLDSDVAQLKAAEQDVSAAEQTAGPATNELRRLDELGRSAAVAQTRLRGLERAGAALADWETQIGGARRTAPALEEWPGTEDDDPTQLARSEISSVQEALENSLRRLASARDQLAGRASSERDRLNDLEDEARDLRRRVEKVQEGAGAAARRLATIRQRVAHVESLVRALAEQRTRRDKVRVARDEAVKVLARIREERFQERHAVAQAINSALGPRIDVEVQQSGLWGSYAEAIAETIRGSGLRYSDLAPEVAACLSPQELVAVVEQDDAHKLASCVNIPEDRARRVIDRFREAGLADVLTARIEDAIELKLLDGSDYKTTEQLSTGQRCTTVLPIILRHEDRPVIIDQPEDHLDGAFIVDTLVQAMLRRTPGSQLIASTHNPNIPVLGNAERVTLLGSNGHRGYEVHSGGLDDSRIVDAITAVMEGGREAFAARAKFYGAA